MLIRFQKLALASLTAAFLSGPAWAGCSDAALALVVDDTVWPVNVTAVEALTDADTDRAGVSLTFDARSARIMGEVTTEHVGETMLIENEGRLVLQGVIRGAIQGGKMEVRGFDNARATEIAAEICGR